MPDTTPPRTTYTRLLPTAISALGTLSVVALVVQWALLGRFQPATLSMQGSLGELVITCLVGSSFVYGGHWIAQSNLAPERYRRIAGWCLVGLIGLLAITLAFIAFVPAPTLDANVTWARTTAMFGAGGGVLVGVIEARSIERARRLERTTAEAEYAETQRQWFDYLNSLLRHEVLNKTNIIEGYATLLLDDVDDDRTRDRLDTIRLQSRQMNAVIDDVRVLIQSTEAPDQFEPVNLASVLTATLSDLQRTHDDVEVETDIPGPVAVPADDLLPRIFSNLLTNAVEHNTDPTPRARVSVGIQTTPETAIVKVADNGPGIPEPTQQCLFERGENTTSNHGLGLYLVDRLVDRYDGSIELTDTGPDGTTFTVELPRGEDPPVSDTSAADGSVSMPTFS